jgi:protein involved in polysaccharide export with SLBB domain
MEHALSADAYRLGPGDMIAVTIWGELPAAHDLMVSPEGKLLIPLVGEIYVNRLLLPEATEQIRAAVKTAYRNVEVSVTLVKLRIFQVHVVGEVLKPGTYEARAVDRLSSVVFRAGGLTERAGMRSIEIRNADTLRTKADLLRFMRLADLGANPLLQDGDVVYVPLRKERVWAQGALRRPGDYELVPGDSLGGLVALAGGLLDGAILDSIEVAGYAPDGVSTELRRFKVPSEGASGGIFGLKGLRGDDRIYIQRLPKFHEERLITIDGEVLYPGVYDIEEDSTTLREAIERAGGFTPQASLEDAELIRTRGEGTKDRDFERLSKLDPSEMAPEEYDYVRARSRQREGWMAIDFIRLFREGDRSLDVVLERGDIIHVPPRRNYVRVMGRVLRPGNVVYRPGADADYYIEEAGGYLWNARRGKVRIIKTISGQWLKKSDFVDLEPGDTVWVPEKPDRDYWKAFRDTVSVLTGLATIYIVAQNATRN